MPISEEDLKNNKAIFDKKDGISIFNGIDLEVVLINIY